jgi:hypothetical protein
MPDNTHSALSSPRLSSTSPADPADFRAGNPSGPPLDIVSDPVATLEARLSDPSTPPAARPGLEAAIDRLYGSRRAAALAEDVHVTRLAEDLLEFCASSDCSLECGLDHLADFNTDFVGDHGERVLGRARDLDATRLGPDGDDRTFRRLRGAAR